LTKYSSLSPGIAGRISQKLDANLFVYGSIKQAGSVLRFDAQLMSTKTREVIKSFTVEGVFREDNIFKIADTLSKNLMDFLVISKLIKKNPILGIYPSTTKSPEAFRNYTCWLNAFGKGNFTAASNWLLKALALDSNYVDAVFSLASTYEAQGRIDKALPLILKLHQKREQVSFLGQLWVDHAYAYSFEPPSEQIGILKQIQEIDDRLPNLYYALGSTYSSMEDFYNAISEFEKCLEMYRKLGKNTLKDNWFYPALGKMYHKTGQYKKEKKLYKEVEKISSDHTTAFFSWIIRNQAILSLTKENSVAANRYIKEFISVLKKNSSSEADIAEGLAVIYWSVEDLEKAEGFYRQALRLDPENPGRINNLANFFISNNRNLNEVSELMDKAMKLAPDTYDYYNYYNYLDTKGWGLYRQGRYLEALEILQKTWDSIPFPIYRIKSHLEEIKMAVAGQK
jgi:tetratricopeptide (TPR) repeat protein